MRLFSCVFSKTEDSFQTAVKLGFFVYFLHVVLILKLGEGSESIIWKAAQAVWYWRGVASKEGSAQIC